MTLDDLRVEEPTARRARPAQIPDTIQAAGPGPISIAEAMASGSRASQAGTTQAGATGYNAQTGEVDPNTMTAAGRMADITGQDSPLMQRAARLGMLTAARRGLGNSSFAAGAATGEMVDRATPLAQQDAATYFQNMRSNLDAINRAREVSTGRETDMSALNAQLAQQVNMQNAAFEQEAAKLNAQLETAVSQQNAQMANEIRQRMAEQDQQRNMFNAEATNRTEQLNAQMEQQANMFETESQARLQEMTLQSNIELNKQYLAGTQALDLQALQSRYQQLISTNQQAAMMYQGYMDAIGSAMANDRITPERMASYITVMRSQMEGALEFMDAVNTLGMGDVQLPGATYTRETGLAPGEPISPEQQQYIDARLQELIAQQPTGPASELTPEGERSLLDRIRAAAESG
jgi:hypothetical protein